MKMKKVWISSNEKNPEKLADIMTAECIKKGIIGLEPRMYDGPDSNYDARKKALVILRQREVDELLKHSNRVIIINREEGFATIHKKA